MDVMHLTGINPMIIFYESFSDDLYRCRCRRDSYRKILSIQMNERGSE
jgi:hypothetical protein